MLIYGKLCDMNAGELIHLYRKKKDMTQDELANRLGVSKAYISVVENGLKAVSLTQLLKFSEVLDIPASEIDRIRKARTKGSEKGKEEFEGLLRAKENLERFLAERGYGVSSGNILMLPVVGKIPAGAPLVTYEDALDISKEFFPVPSSEVRHGRCFFLKVVGDSMVDFGINEGDLVLIDPEDREVGGVGRVMAIEVNGEITLKTVVRIDDRRLRLISENARYAPVEVDMKKKPVRIIGTVLPFMARRNLNIVVNK